MATRNEFCTLFDVNYLPRGLVLYRSLRKTCDDFRLRVFCMDEATEGILERMTLPGMEVIGREELETHDRDLRAVKTTRSQVEFCWTATPAVCLYALEREPDLELITYVDADVQFLADPAPIFDELGDESVLIVPHRHSPQWEGWETTVGNYNVEFLTFRRDEAGLTPLRWWRERCLEWCYDRFEDGKWGDQRYLDDWPERFPGVHVLAHPGGGLAPWNVGGHTLTHTGGRLLVDGLPVVFIHLQSLKLLRVPRALARLRLLPERYHSTAGPVPFVWTIDWPLSDRERELVWDPYVREIGRALEDVRRVEPGFGAGFTPMPAGELAREAALHAARRWLPRPFRHALKQGYRSLSRPVDPT